VKIFMIEPIIKMFSTISKIMQFAMIDRSPTFAIYTLPTLPTLSPMGPMGPMGPLPSMTSKRYMLETILNRSRVDHRTEILNQGTLKDAHIYCKINSLSGQQTGPLIENYIKNRYQMTKNLPSDCNGDLRLNDSNLEIKVSNGGNEHNRFNYVQLRMNHNCEYLFTAYYLDDSNVNQEGELYIFRINKEAMKPLILRYGSYAHGTKTKLGSITYEDLNSSRNTKEYALRPKFNDDCWKSLLKFRVLDVQ
jgi:hypothetical protein